MGVQVYSLGFLTWWGRLFGVVSVRLALSREIMPRLAVNCAPCGGYTEREGYLNNRHYWGALLLSNWFQMDPFI